MLLLVWYICLKVAYAQQSSWYYSNETLPAAIFDQQVGYYQDPEQPEIVYVYIIGGDNGFATVSNNHTDVIDEGCDGLGVWKSTFNRTSLLLSKWITLPIKTITHCMTSESQSAISIDNIIYFVGIYDNDYTNYPTGKIYRFDMKTEKWLNTSYIPIQPIPQIKGCVSTNQTHIFSIGGLAHTGGNKNITNKLQILDIKENKWHIGNENLPFSTVYQYCNIIDNHILYVFGGQEINGQLNNGIYKYDVGNIANSKWQFIGNLTSDPSNQYGWLTYDYKNNLLYPIGGLPASDSIDIFDIKSETIIGKNKIDRKDEVHCAPSLIIDDIVMIFGGKSSSLQINSVKNTNLVQMASLPLKSSE